MSFCDSFVRNLVHLFPILFGLLFFGVVVIIYGDYLCISLLFYSSELFLVPGRHFDRVMLLRFSFDLSFLFRVLYIALVCYFNNINILSVS